jgi:hypothetical protein
MGLTLTADGSALPSRYRGAFSVKRRVNGQWITYGPYTCQRIPVSGTERMGMAGVLAETEERIFFPANAVLAVNDVVWWVERNKAFSAIYVHEAPQYLEAYCKSTTVPVLGTK